VAEQQVTVPDIGGAEGAEVIELLVNVGDDITVDQGLIVLESDKASMEIPSTVAGKLVKLLVSEGEQLAEGAPVAVIEVASAEEEESQPEPEPDSASGDAAQNKQQTTREPATENATSSDSSAVAGGGASESAGAASSELAVPVPDIGTDEAVELIEICVKVGDVVGEGDSLVVLESDKASMEVPAPDAGEVLAISVKEGDSVKQNDVLLTLKVQGRNAASAEEEKVDAAPVERQEARPEAGEATAPAPTAQSQNTAAPSAEGVYAGPAVRKLAREFGVALEQVHGTGPRGRVVKEDLQQFVQNALSTGAAAGASAAAGAGIPDIPEIDFSKFGAVEVTQRSKLDKLTAANMRRSWLNVPHVTQFEQADITELEAFRAGLKDEAQQRGTRLTPMPFLLKACAVALRDNPKFMTSLAQQGEELIYKQYCHIGMAVDTPAGLVVPVIRDVDKKSIWQLAEEVLELADKARDRKLKPADMQGGVFTVSSLGNIGGTGFTPIVNAPEVGILGVSRAQIQPVWDGQEFAPRKMLPLALSYDHRVINGGDGGRFITRLTALLGDIRQLVM
tara:strand:- start:84605 stop:86296 length:1692 start_codon:yes stop_codon:yes gene_type:complete